MPANPKTTAQVRRQRLLTMLAEGSFYSGELLAKKLKISRGGIWKLMRSLKALGVDVESVPRQGYRLPRAVDLLEKEAITAAMPASARSHMERCDVLLTVDSTNRFVADLPPPTAERFQLCTAEVQNAGRGRRGRTWIAPFGSGVCMSVGWQFAEAPPTFSALSLAVGVAVVTAFQRLHIEGVGLKWPNDLQWQGRKLGGILIEMRGESAGPAQVIIGIGINMQMPAPIRMHLAEHQAALIADVHEITREKTPARNVLIGCIAGELLQMLQTFATQGFVPFREQWQQLDTLANAPVKVISGSQNTLGTARGVEVDGTLLVEVDGQLRKFVSGEVSLRAAKG